MNDLSEIFSKFEDAQELSDELIKEIVPQINEKIKGKTNSEILFSLYKMIFAIIDEQSKTDEHPRALRHSCINSLADILKMRLTLD